MGHVKKKGIKTLTKRQLAVIDDLFEGRYDETKLIKKHKVSRKIYRKWYGDKNFVDELSFRIESAKMQSEMIIARHAPIAATKLVELAKSEKDETSRKACLDVIAQPITINSPKTESKSVHENISTEAAERMLAAIAKKERGEV